MRWNRVRRPLNSVIIFLHITSKLLRTFSINMPIMTKNVELFWKLISRWTKICTNQAHKSNYPKAICTKRLLWLNQQISKSIGWRSLLKDSLSLCNIFNQHDHIIIILSVFQFRETIIIIQYQRAGKFQPSICYKRW